MVTRRSILLSFAGALAAGTAAPGNLFAREKPRHTLDVAITNNTGRFGNRDILCYVIGSELGSGRSSYVRGDGALVPCQLSDNGGDGFADYAIPLAPRGVTRLTLPRMSGRVYFSIGAKLKIKVVAAGQAGGVGVQLPAGWVESDPNYSILHDWIEFTFDDYGMHCNTTMVDMFSIPLALRLTGKQDRTSGALVPGGREKIFADLAANKDFQRLIVGDNLRVIAPGHGINAGSFSATYLDGYIANCWKHYETRTLTVANDVFGAFEGTVDAGTQRLNFAQQGKVIASFAPPSTRDVFFCDGALAAPNNVAGSIAAVLGAALNRTTLQAIPEQPATDAARFYQVAATNHYSSAMHAHSQDGLAYGFAFDDVAGFAPYLSDPAPTDLNITLTPFGGQE